jgi:hypothetical protein
MKITKKFSHDILCRSQVLNLAPRECKSRPLPLNQPPRFFYLNDKLKSSSFRSTQGYCIVLLTSNIAKGACGEKYVFRRWLRTSEEAMEWAVNALGYAEMYQVFTKLCHCAVRFVWDINSFQLLLYQAPHTSLHLQCLWLRSRVELALGLHMTRCRMIDDKNFVSLDFGVVSSTVHTNDKGLFLSRNIFWNSDLSITLWLG